MLNLLFLVLGLALVLLGANFLTDGASGLARRFHLPEIVIGLTIVSFGTSAPELAISLSSALQGSADMAAGNVIGSNIMNTLLIVGVTSAVAPIVITRNTLTNEIPLCVLASLMMWVCCGDQILSGELENIISRTEGLMLLGFFSIFMAYTFAISKHDASDGETVVIGQMPLWKSLLYIIGGLVGLIWGGDLFVDGATGLARSLGMSESLIALTLVAGGTSLPELATSVVAALKKNPEIAIGNAIGSNLFNIFLIIGATSSITPLHLSGIGQTDLAVLFLSSILLYAVGLFNGKRIIKRPEGILLTLCYVGYVVYLGFQG